MSNVIGEWLIILIALLILMIYLSSPKYQFYDVTLSTGHVQLRGNVRTGELEQVYIKERK